MRRVSSRQRLVSWDAFDATDNDAQSDNASVNDYHSAVLDNVDNSPTSNEVGRKRDRSTMRKSDSAGSIGANSLLQQLSTPSLVEPAVVTTAIDKSDKNGDMFLPLDVPTLVSGEAWEIDHASMNHTIGSSNNNLFHLKNSLSTNTLSSFVSTCSTLPPSPTAASESVISFDNLMKDMHVAIFAFLDLESLQTVMAVNRNYRSLTLDKDAHSALWQGHCDEKWKVNPRTQQETPVEYKDHFHLPTAASASDSNAANISLLLKMTPSEYPTGVNETLIEQQNARTERLRPRNNRPAPQGFRRLPQAADMPPAEDGLPGYVRMYKDDKGRSLVRYTGPIGAGDRCIRSNAALPRPQPQQESLEANDSLASSIMSTSNFFRSNSGGGSNSRQLLMNIWRRGAMRNLMNSDGNRTTPTTSSKASITSTTASSWKPFVTPFMENESTVNVTPRLISYYEVSILLAPLDTSDNDDDDDSFTGPAAAPRPARSDCVAVGLATESFHAHTRMPGWDRQSFGYHGDDAGIFHASGGMVKEFGSKFGEGDTIGCGVDYVNKGIFFTLNGDYLGYGWKGIEDEFLKNDLFPVVGLDSNCPLYFNFGQEEAFQFDLSKFLMKHESIIAPQYSLRDTKSLPKHVDSTASLRSMSSCSSLASMASVSSSTRRSRRLLKRRGARDRR